MISEQQRYHIAAQTDLLVKGWLKPDVGWAKREIGTRVLPAAVAGAISLVAIVYHSFA